MLTPRTPLNALRRLAALPLLMLLLLGSAETLGQSMNSLHGRLSPMPVTAATVKTITGQGEVRAILNGNTLNVSGHFEGMSSSATMAHIHMGPKAIPGPVILRLDITSGTSVMPCLAVAAHSRASSLRLTRSLRFRRSSCPQVFAWA